MSAQLADRVTAQLPNDSRQTAPPARSPARAVLITASRARDEALAVYQRVETPYLRLKAVEGRQADLERI